MLEKLQIGKIVNTHGIKGELKVKPMCDDISVFKALKVIYINGKSFDLVSAKEHKNCYLIKINGLDDINNTAPFINQDIFADKSDLPELVNDTFYISDLIGLSVYNSDSSLLGTLTDCFPTGSNDVYVVKPENGKDILIPAIKDVIKKIDIAEGKMTVNLTEEYFDDEN